MASLSLNTVSIWHANLETTPIEYRHLSTLLSEKEKQRANNFKNATLRQHFMLARGILRSLLSYFTKLPAQSLEFGYTQNGKPYLLDNPSIHFNLSHSRNKALYAFTLDTAIGIDLEYQNPRSKIERIARRYFSPREYHALQTLSAALRRIAFFTAWTQKEALLKALGLNLLSISNIEVEINATAPRILTVHNIPFNCAEWSLSKIAAPAHFSAALAIQRPCPNIQIQDWHMH